MPRIQAIDPEHATVSPVVLKGHLAFNEALGSGELPAATGEAIALAGCPRVPDGTGAGRCQQAHWSALRH